MHQIIDLHCDTIGEVQAGANLREGNPGGHIDISRLRKGNVGCQIFACYISSVVPEKFAYKEVVTLLNLINDICEVFSSDFQKVESVSDLSSCAAQNKIGVISAVENGHAIANNIKNLEKLYDLGTRYMTLTHSKNLEWAASSGESECSFDGLTSFGESVVSAMNEIGMIIDVSHVHESTFWAVAKKTKKPVIASHSNSAALCPIPRNLKDDQIKAIAETGGMVGINFYPGFLNKEYEKKQNERCGDLFLMLQDIEKDLWQDAKERQQAMNKLGTELNSRMVDLHVGIESIVDHITYIVDLVGDDYVGFGSDFDGLPALPVGVTGCDIFPSIIGVMDARGFSNSSIKKICSQNFIRIFEAIQ